MFSLTFANLHIEICPIFIMNYFIFIYIYLYLDINLGISDSSASKESTSNAGDPSLIPGLGRSTGEGIGCPFQYSWASPVAQTVKNLPAMWETWVQSLGWEDPLEEGMATHSSILAWRIQWTEEPGRLKSMRLQRVRHNWVTKHSMDLNLAFKKWSTYIHCCCC